MTTTDLAPPRQRAPRGQKVCRYVFVPGDSDGEPGETHGLALTPENSYQHSSYCKTHHNRVMMRNRQTSETAHASNIERTKRWQQRNPGKVAQLKKDSRQRLASGQAKHPTRGRPIARPALPAPEPTPALPPPEPPAVEWVSGAFRAGQKHHLRGPGTMSECGQWRTAFSFEQLPADDPRICAACLRKRRARKQAQPA